MLLCSQEGTVGFGDTYFSHVARHVPKHPCTCGEWYDKCEPRAGIADAIRAAGTTDFEWSDLASVPIPKLFRSPLRRFWPLARSTRLPIVCALPHSARRGLFARFYRENELMINGLGLSGKYDTYFDGCKDLVRLELMRTIIPNIKILHSVRHPGAYLYHFHKRGENQYSKRLSHWARYHRHARRFAERVPADNYLAVTYEHIVRRPAEFASSFAKFVGKPPADTTDADRLRTSEIHIMGNRMRERADRVLDYSSTWRGKMPHAVEKMADDAIRDDEWYASLYNLD